MKLPVLILLLAFSLMVKAQEMRWEKDRPLVWKDFKGPPADGGPHIAETFSGIKYSFHVKRLDTLYQITFDVQGWFNSEKSWVKRGNKNKDVLQHEQLHFDITELYALMLYDTLSRAKYTANYREEIHDIYDYVSKSCRDRQHKYDEQVAYNNTGMVEVWKKYVHNEIDRLSAGH